MKRILPMLLALFLVTSNVGAQAQTPEFMTQLYTNYTADYSISLTFESSEDIAALLEEVEMPEEISYFVDVKSLLKTLLSYEGKMKLEADISENYDKIQIGLTAENTQAIDVNANLRVGLGTKTGMWLDMDLTDAENPVFDIIYSYPLMNKYIKISAGDVLEPEVMAMLQSILNKETIEGLGKASVETLLQYATVESANNQYILKIDNKGFIAYMKALMPYISGMMKLMGAENDGVSMEIPSLDGWQLLGEGGIQSVYTTYGNTIVSEVATADISFDFSKIYTAVSGEAWPYSAAGKLDFTMKISADVSQVGSTSVAFPALTEENAISMENLVPEYTYDTAVPEEEQYPAWYVYGRSDILPVVDGVVYVPLRQTIESAYDESTAISFDNGIVTVSSGYFPGFAALTVAIGSDKVYADSAEYTIGKSLLINDTTYVSSKLFCDVFGWSLSYADHDLLTGEYSYSFSTYSYPSEY